MNSAFLKVIFARTRPIMILLYTNSFIFNSDFSVSVLWVEVQGCQFCIRGKNRRWMVSHSRSQWWAIRPMKILPVSVSKEKNDSFEVNGPQQERVENWGRKIY